MHSTAQLSLVIPCYNEARNLPALISRCTALIEAGRKEDISIEVVLVDNGSSDDTPAILQALPDNGCRSVRVPENQGYGHGILTGLTAARGEIIGWTHADSQTDPLDALAGLKALSNADKSRFFLKGARRGRPISDEIFTFGMSIFESLLMGKVLVDINAQPTMFPKSFMNDWKSPPNDFSLDLYAYWMAKRKKLKIYRIPVIFHERLHGTSHWNTSLANKWKFISRTLSYSFKLKSSAKELGL